MKKGFTLIELLIVIAIIGVLASIVLVSLNTARSKGSDAAIKSSIYGARNQAELYYDSNGQDYSGVCDAASSDSPAGIADMKTAAETAGGTNVICHDTADGWALEAQLKADNTHWYCIDYKGDTNLNSGTGLGGGSGDITC